MLSYHFVRTGVLSLEHGSTFSNLFDKRHSGDYEDFAYCDAALVDSVSYTHLTLPTNSLV